MSLGLLLDMAVAGDTDRMAVVCGDSRWTTGRLDELADLGAGVIAGSGASHVVYVGTGGEMLPLLIFSCARAGVAFTPLNYRLSTEGIQSLIDRLPDPLVVVDERYRDVVRSGDSTNIMSSEDFLATANTAEPTRNYPDPESVAVILFTSGTTSRPKAVELSHHNLTSYVTSTVEFAAADSTEAVLICVPPYHIAGVGAALSNLYAGRKMVYLTEFDPSSWVRLIDAEAITTATVVPTMLDRIVDVLQDEATPLPTLRNLAYGGSKVPLPLVRKALVLLPHVGFVNAYGLTETSSTISVLTPEDHRAACHSTDTAAAARLASVGRPVPGIEVQIRTEGGSVADIGETGELFVRGEQVSGRYAEIGSVLDAEGWFPTKDIARLDSEGYLFISGRNDDTIIRGGENIAPAEIEDVLAEHPAVRQVAVVGVPDAGWGQITVAVIVPAAATNPDPDELRAYARKRLRGSRTPDRVVFRPELPTTPTGKVLRRNLVDDLVATLAVKQGAET